MEMCMTFSIAAHRAHVWVPHTCTMQSVMALNHIHSKKIIHRDIKSLNLFIDSKDNIKVGWLGGCSRCLIGVVGRVEQW